MKIYENKMFIFDRPIIRWKYYLLKCYSFLVSLYYKAILGSIKPDVIEKKYKVSICAIFRNEALYLKEWIEFHRLVGIDHFYLYNNFSDDDYKSILDPYVKTNIVTIVDWPVKQGQMKAYEDCVARFSKDTQWIGFIDLDEFIVPISVNSVYMFLKRFEKNRPVVIVYWKMFGSSGLLKRDTKRPVVEDFTVSWKKPVNIGKYFFNTAYEYDPSFLKNTDMHIWWGKYRGVMLPPVNQFDKVILRDVHRGTGNMEIQINHYLLKSYDEYFRIKRKRGDAYFSNSNHDDEYFEEHEQKAMYSDYTAFKYLTKLKLILGMEK